MILFIVLGFMVILAVSKLIVDIRNVQVMNVLELELEIGDEGGKLVSLLSSGNGSTERMETIGMMYLSGMEKEEKAMNGTLMPMLNRLAMLNSTGDVVRVMGYPVRQMDKRFEAEVPFPGGKGAKRTVRLEK